MGPNISKKSVNNGTLYQRLVSLRRLSGTARNVYWLHGKFKISIM